jgi:hypothetical protein
MSRELDAAVLLERLASARNRAAKARTKEHGDAAWADMIAIAREIVALEDRPLQSNSTPVVVQNYTEFYGMLIANHPEMKDEIDAAIEAQVGQLRSQLATQAAPAPLLPRLANEVRDATRKAVSLPVVSVGAAKAD